MTFSHDEFLSIAEYLKAQKCTVRALLSYGTDYGVLPYWTCPGDIAVHVQSQSVNLSWSGGARYIECGGALTTGVVGQRLTGPERVGLGAVGGGVPGTGNRRRTAYRSNITSPYPLDEVPLSAHVAALFGEMRACIAAVQAREEFAGVVRMPAPRAPKLKWVTVGED